MTFSNRISKENLFVLSLYLLVLLFIVFRLVNGYKIDWWLLTMGITSTLGALYYHAQYYKSTIILIHADDAHHIEKELTRLGFTKTLKNELRVKFNMRDGFWRVYRATLRYGPRLVSFKFPTKFEQQFERYRQH